MRQGCFIALTIDEHGLPVLGQLILHPFPLGQLDWIFA